MIDVLKGVVGKSAFLVPWIFAASIGFGAGGLFLLPPASDMNLAGPIGHWDPTTKGLVLLTAAVLVGFTLGAASTPLYRLLEGYLGPAEWWNVSAEGQRRIRRDLQSQLDALNKATVQAALLYEKLDRFPVDENQMAPTRLGNALRAFETYGVDRYDLDSQLLWYELISVAPKKLQDELDNSRAGTDFFVAMMYMSAAYGLTSLILFQFAVYRGLYLTGLSLWIQAILAAVVFPVIFYRLAVSSTAYWATTVRALVNIGRVKLAEQLGLELPNTIEQERRMWRTLRTFLFYPYSKPSGRPLNIYRMKAKPSPDAGASTKTQNDGADDDDEVAENDGADGDSSD